jgi:hypothetical protein
MPKFKVTKRWEDINGAEAGELFCLLNEGESLIEEHQEELDYAAKILEEKNGIGFVIPDVIVSSEVSQTMSVLYNHGINQFSGILLTKLFDLTPPKPQESAISSVMQQYLDNGYSYTLLKEPIILLKV